MYNILKMHIRVIIIPTLSFQAQLGDPVIGRDPVMIRNSDFRVNRYIRMKRINDFRKLSEWKFLTSKKKLHFIRM